ncbi:hypothetical protein ACFE04_018245 [Oxalis oulophora]
MATTTTTTSDRHHHHKHNRFPSDDESEKPSSKRHKHRHRHHHKSKKHHHHHHDDEKNKHNHVDDNHDLVISDKRIVDDDVEEGEILDEDDINLGDNASADGVPSKYEIEEPVTVAKQHSNGDLSNKYDKVDDHKSHDECRTSTGKQKDHHYDELGADEVKLKDHKKYSPSESRQKVSKRSPSRDRYHDEDRPSRSHDVGRRRSRSRSIVEEEIVSKTKQRYDHDKSRDTRYDSMELARDGDKHHSRKTQDRERSRDMDTKDRSREKDYEDSRHRDSERDRRREREYDRSRTREMSIDRRRESERDRDVDRDRNKERDRVRDNERDKNRDKARESEREKKRERLDDRNRVNRNRYDTDSYGDGYRDQDKYRHSRDDERDKTRKNGSSKAQVSNSNSADVQKRDEFVDDDFEESPVLVLADKEEEDLEKIKEESRKRRLAILEKYKNKETQQQNNPIPKENEKDKELQVTLTNGVQNAGNDVQDVEGKGDGLQVIRSGLNDNWDDAEGYYSYRFGEVLDGRYEVAAAHGKGVFSTVVRAKDLKASTSEPAEVAIKIIRNNETMHKAGQLEVQILKKLVGSDPEDKRHCVRFLSSFKYRNHLCLVFESLHMNLREVLKKFGRNIGLKLTAIRTYAKQLFIALKHLKNCGVLHCDIKPDNMLVNEAKNVLKLCDFGNAMFAGKNEVTPYLVSRFYRAPEIILGLQYDHPMDIWSVGCCLYELYTGKVLFPGATNNDMLRLHMELKGLFSKKMLRKGAFTDQHFDHDLNFHATEDDPVTQKTIKRMIVNIKPKDLGSIMESSLGEDPKMLANFKDILDKIFTLDPDKRMTVSQALAHPFITVSLDTAFGVTEVKKGIFSLEFLLSVSIAADTGNSNIIFRSGYLSLLRGNPPTLRCLNGTQEKMLVLEIVTTLLLITFDPWPGYFGGICTDGVLLKGIAPYFSYSCKCFQSTLSSLHFLLNCYW